jgi:hypothetical protein
VQGDQFSDASRTLAALELVREMVAREPGNSFFALLVDLDPLPAGSFREEVDSLLRNLNPFARADFGANSGFDLVEVAEHPQAP